MSTIIKRYEGRRMAHIVRTDDGKTYYVDSNDTFDRGYETMAFRCNSNGENIDWSGCYCELYTTSNDMCSGHERIINNLEQYVEDDDEYYEY